MNKNLVIVKTDKDARRILPIIDDNNTSICSVERNDFMTNEYYLKIFILANINELEEKCLFNRLKFYNCIDKNSEIIHINS